MTRDVSLLSEASEGAVMEQLRELLETTMRERNWRAPQLAEAMGCSEDLARRWLRGERRLQVEDMVRLAQLSRTDLNAMFEITPRNARLQVGEADLRRLIREEMISSSRALLRAALLALDDEHQHSAGPGSGRSSVLDPTMEERQGAPDTLSSLDNLPADALEAISRIIAKEPQQKKTRRRYK